MNDVIVFIVLSLASGRVAYSLTKDEIFRPMREWIWMRSAPEEGVIVERGGEGDVTRPARMYHLMHRDPVDGDWRMSKMKCGPAMAKLNDQRYRFDPGVALRKPGFFGQLFECFYCMSFWTSLLACAAWLVLGDDVIYPALPLALWGASNVIAARGL